MHKKSIFLEGIKDGTPIALGYFAVGFSVGIACRNAGLDAIQGFLISFLNMASAGEYAGLTVIAANSGYLEIAIITLITNARYFLMSCALSQRFSPDTPMIHRLCVGYAVTDELFGITIARPGYIQPVYNYGAMVVTIFGWSVGTMLGVIIGNLLPIRLVSALSVALFGMFLAVIIPPAKQNKVVFGLVAISFLCSYGANLLPWISGLSAGTRTILLTVVLSTVAAILFPIATEEEAES